MKTIVFSILFALSVSLYAQEMTDSVRVDSATDSQKINLSFNGQITVWEITQFTNPLNWQLGGRFLPTFLGSYSLRENSMLDFEASAHINGSLNFSDLKNVDNQGEIKPYRIWLRYSGNNWELRGGLQKINFGVARMFRPLMWFDGMDVRDPLQLTDGVHGLLGKYFFENNASIWLWSLIGNNKQKGWELIGSSRWHPEIGGRVEFPAFTGEMGLSTHHRKVDVHNFTILVPENTLLNESRLGLEGRWDVGVGLWFETSFTKLQKNSHNIALHQDAVNLGMDYTFPVGNGVGMTLEYFRYHIGNEFIKNGLNLNLLGGMFTYPVSILDNLTAMCFYVTNHDMNLWFNYINWARTYDKWSFYLMGYWNPEISLALGGQIGSKNLFMGKGIQLMASYNF